jgi:hypothetical protein
VEVYTPIPSSARRRPRRWAPRFGALTVALAIGVGAIAAVVFMNSPRDDITLHSFGIVQTAFGPAEVQCGGESAAPCNEASTLRFLTCSEPARRYMTGYYGDDQDARVHELIHARPPQGSRWEFSCGWYEYWPPPLSKPATLASDG